MKRLFAVVLAAALMVAPVWALDDPAESADEQQAEQQTAEAVTVTTLEQLQDAIDAAEDGATIIIEQTITVNGQSLATEKDITLTRAEGMSGAMIDLWNGGEISGFSFTESGAKYSYSTISIDYCYNNAVTIDNCNFIKEEGAASYFVVYGNVFSDDPNRAIISACNFELSSGNAIKTRNHTHITLDGCSFTAHGGGIAWAVDNAGTAVLQDCAIAGSGVQTFSIRNSATMQINNITITRDNRDNKAVFDIFSTANATISITQESAGQDAVYSVATKTPLELPLTNYSGELQLVYLTEDEAAAYFAPDDPEEPEDTPADPADDEQEDTPQPPQQPQDEPQPEQGNDPADTPAEPPAQEDEPPQDEDTPAAQDSAEDNTQDEQTAPAAETPQPQPEQPRQYIPYTPIYTPSRDDSSNDAEDTPTAPAVEVAAKDTPSIDALTCGGAAMDTTQRLDLDYMGGTAMLDKSLTRAEMAMLVYSLLDVDTITQDSDSGSAFVDVPPDAEYAPFVQLIASCGIVQGVGGGKYAPESAVTWQQIIVLLSRFVEAQDHTLQYIACESWAQDAMQTAVAYGWITDNAEFDATAEITVSAQLETIPRFV